MNNMPKIYVFMVNHCKYTLNMNSLKISYTWFYMYILIVCLFACLEVFVSLENCSLIWRRHHCWWKDANFDLFSALMAIEQWGFFSVPHLLWHRASVYFKIVYLRGLMTLTPIAELLTVELSLPILTTSVTASIRTPNFPLVVRTL